MKELINELEAWAKTILDGDQKIYGPYKLMAEQLLEKLSLAKSSVGEEVGKCNYDEYGWCAGLKCKFKTCHNPHHQELKTPTSQDGLRELLEWAAKQEIYTDPETDYDSHDLSEKGGYKSAMWNVVEKGKEILSRHPVPQAQDEKLPSPFACKTNPLHHSTECPASKGNPICTCGGYYDRTPKPRPAKQEAQNDVVGRLREVMKTEHYYTWIKSNESLLVIMQENQGCREQRMASHFEECLLNALDRVCSSTPIPVSKLEAQDGRLRATLLKAVDRKAENLTEQIWMDTINGALALNPTPVPVSSEGKGTAPAKEESLALQAGRIGVGIEIKLYKDGRQIGRVFINDTEAKAYLQGLADVKKESQ